MKYTTEARADLCNAMWLLEELAESFGEVEHDMHQADSVQRVSPFDLLWAAHAYVQHAWQNCEQHEKVRPLSENTMKTVATLKMQAVIDEAKFQPADDV